MINGIEVNINAPPHVCARCAHTLVVGQRRKRIRYGAQTIHNGRLLRLCRKCARRVNAPTGTTNATDSAEVG